MNFYESRENIDGILWVVPSKSDALKILRQSKEISTNLLEKHSVVLLKDFYSNFWDALISFGAFKGELLEKLLVPTPIICSSDYSNTYHRQLLSNGYLSTRNHTNLKNNLSTIISG